MGDEMRLAELALFALARSASLQKVEREFNDIFAPSSKMKLKTLRTSYDFGFFPTDFNDSDYREIKYQ